MEKLIYSALAKINKGIGAIEKNRKNQQQGFQFRGIDDVLNELHSLFADNDVIILPSVKAVETSEKQTKTGGVLFYVKANIDFTFITTDGSSVTVTIVGEAMDSGDKATNKAMSVALKYALIQMFLIPTKEDKDPDAVTHEIKPTPVKSLPTPVPAAISPELEEALFAVDISESVEVLEKVWEGYEKLHKNKQFIDYVKQAKLKLLKKVLK
jgi:hypothetical protein